jgi:hypothetical protein
MNTNSFFYPFDPTGSATTNLVSGERQVINSSGIMNFFYIVPKAGPFYRDSLKVKLYPSGVELVEGIDYNPTHYFHAGSHSTGLALYGSITFYDHTLTGTVSLEYQTIGGDWVLDEAAITQLLANNLVDPRITTWDEAVDLPYQFPVIDHEFNIDNFIGADDIVTKLISIKEAINAMAAGTSSSHMQDFSNPHQVNKTHVGLGVVENYGVASLTQAQQGTSGTTYMTPVRTLQAIQALAWPRIDDHINNLNDPHDVTKTQVGLGNVENYIIASTVESEQGSLNTRYMTPVRTKEAIAKQALFPLNAFIARRDNPNDVTAAQVGLGNVSDFATGTNVDALAGTADNKFLAVREIVVAIRHFATEPLDLHLADFENPHVVTATQIGLGLVQNYPIASSTDAANGTSDVVYTTPKSVRQMIAAFAPIGGGGTTSEHDLLKNNPHETTATQVGLGDVSNYGIADTIAAQLGISNEFYMTPLRTKEAITSQVKTTLTAHIDDFENPHGTTKTQVGLGNVENYPLATQVDAEEGLVLEAYMSPALTKHAIAYQVGDAFQSHVTAVGNAHGLTAAELGVYTTAVTDNMLLGKLGATSTAVNSGLLQGRTAEEILVAFIASGRAGANQVTAPQIVPVFYTLAPLDPIINESTWTKLGTWNPTLSEVNALAASSLSFIIEGGGELGELGVPVSLLSLGIDSGLWNAEGTVHIDRAHLTPLNDKLSAYKLFTEAGYDGDKYYLTIWSNDTRLRTKLNITELSGRHIQWTLGFPNTIGEDAIIVEPVGLTAVDITAKAVYENSFDALLTGIVNVTTLIESI